MNPLRWVSELVGTFDGCEEIAFIMWCAALLVGALISGDYDQVTSVATSVLLGLLLALPASLLLSVILRFLAEVFDGIG